jgi:signal transduction histidine kinase
MMAQVSETQRVLTGRTLSLNEAVSARTAELEHANAALREALAAADRANAAKSAFLAAMSHELRTPLNAIIGFSEIIAGNMLGAGGAARYRDYAKDITESGHHLLAIINDLLDMVKIEAGRLEFHIEDVAVETVVDEVLRMLRGRISEAKLDCQLALAEGLPPARADRRIVKQVVVNLLSNAIKFTPPAGKITIAARRDAGFVVLSVADTGIGMTADEVAHAAEPFYQADRSLARRFGGTGLGLTLVKAFVEQHSGRLAIASEPALGTTITVSFPAAVPGAPAPRETKQLAGATPPMR